MSAMHGYLTGWQSKSVLGFVDTDRVGQLRGKLSPSDTSEEGAQSKKDKYEDPSSHALKSARTTQSGYMTDIITRHLSLQVIHEHDKEDDDSESVGATRPELRRISRDLKRDPNSPPRDLRNPKIGLVMRVLQDFFAKAQADANSINVPARTLLGTIGVMLLKGAVVVGKGLLRIATSLVSVAGRTLVHLARPMLVGLAKFMFTPVGLAAVAVSGLGVMAYLSYRHITRPAAGIAAQEFDVTQFTQSTMDRRSPAARSSGGSSSSVHEQYTGRSIDTSGVASSDRVATVVTRVDAKRVKGARDIIDKHMSVPVGQAIQEASRVTGMSAGILTAIAYKESRFRPDAKAPTSSALGLFQFLNRTWAHVVKAYGSKYGVPANASRLDPVASSIMGGAYLKHDVLPSIRKARPTPNATDLYLGHFMGPAGGRSWLMNMSRGPSRYAYQDYPKAAAANRWVYWHRDGRPRTYAEIYNFFASDIQRFQQAVDDPSSVAETAPNLGSATPDNTKERTQAAAAQTQQATPARHVASPPTPQPSYIKMGNTVINAAA